MVMTSTNALVVGGSGAVGSAVVNRLADDGCRVLSASRSLGLDREGVCCVTCDVLASNAGRTLRGAVEAELGGCLDVLVWCAGTLGVITPTRSVTTDDMIRLYREHVTCFLEAVGELASFLDQSDTAAIIAFSGGGATAPFPRYTPYAAAKVALVRVIENLAEEEPTWRVNAIAPGFIASKMHDVTLAAGAEAVGSYFEETRTRLMDPVPPSAAADLVSFLISPAGVGITGRLISAPWDPWADVVWRERLRSHPTLGRLRRVDDQWVVDRREGE